MKFAVFVGAMAVAVQGSSLRETLREELKLLDEESTSKTPANHPICMEILNHWWPNRQALKGQTDEISSLDAICAQWSTAANERQCNFKNERVGVSAAEKKAACSMVGAGSKKCISNPCNHLNTGDCTLQGTQGRCIWYTQEMVDKANAYWSGEGAGNLGARNIPGLGCYRNPCNLPGEGTTNKNGCYNGQYDVPGLWTCTWCAGGGPKSNRPLQGKKMGCQMETLDTSANCAPVNNNDVNKNSIQWEDINHSCQCSTDFSVCKELVTGRSGFSPRFG